MLRNWEEISNVTLCLMPGQQRQTSLHEFSSESLSGHTYNWHWHGTPWKYGPLLPKSQMNSSCFMFWMWNRGAMCCDWVTKHSVLTWDTTVFIPLWEQKWWSKLWYSWSMVRLKGTPSWRTVSWDWVLGPPNELSTSIWHEDADLDPKRDTC
jgi:hypothetical protein